MLPCQIRVNIKKTEEKFMNKKILALALALVFIATAFTACKKGPELTEINGEEYPLAQNANGETIINEDNQIAVLVTDKNKEVLTYSDGENQTHWLQINGPLVIQDRVQTKEYSLGIPKGWQGNEISGKVTKDGTDGKCYIQLMKVDSLKGETTIETYLEEVDAQNTAIAEAFEDEEQMDALIAQYPGYAAYKGCKYTFAKNTAMISSGLNANVRVHKIVDKNGEVIHFAENYYFVANKSIYKLDYICEGGTGYDDEFNFRQYISESFTFKETK
jgi:hypothetical protein